MRGFRIFFSLVLMAACGGSDATDRRTIIDSRDNYDPRSLDPALSTDLGSRRIVKRADWLRDPDWRRTSYSPGGARGPRVEPPNSTVPAGGGAASG